MIFLVIVLIIVNILGFVGIWNYLSDIRDRVNAEFIATNHLLNLILLELKISNDGTTDQLKIMDLRAGIVKKIKKISKNVKNLTYLDD